MIYCTGWASIPRWAAHRGSDPSVGGDPRDATEVGEVEAADDEEGPSLGCLTAEIARRKDGI